MESVRSWRTPAPHKPLFGQKVEPVPATRIFDQLSFIGTPNVGCFVLETGDGFILLDCMEPLEEHRDMIVQGIADLGLELKDLKAILITHGHGDHYGTADWFRAQTGCTIWMSEVDYHFAQHDLRNRTGVLKWEIHDYLCDGDVFRQGNAEIHVFHTPGHTPGCMSFVFRVTDEGRPHMVAMWGGTGIPWSMQHRVDYMRSCLYFSRVTEKMGCDAEISTHPFVDKGTERMAILRSICDGVPNPFVLGREGYKYYENMFTEMCLNALAAKAKEADAVLPDAPQRPGRPHDQK